MVPLTAEELINHPEFKTVTWDLKPTEKGSFEVARGRGGPIDIAYEIHGDGPIRLVWVMGLGSMMAGWQRQTKDFGHDQGSKYRCLIFDNRGMGRSGKPLMRYSTSSMAEDAFELLDSLGWTSDRQLHVIGISMGGMIAQEMAFKQPERVASLSLVSTASHLVNTVGFVANLRQRINLFIPKGLDVQLAEIKKNLFSEDWLAAPDAEGNFPTNGDRVAAQEVKKRQDTEAFTRKGFLLQAIATGWHHKSPEQMREIGDKVGRERIQVLHGTIDNMITVPHGETLVKELGGEESGVTRKVFEGRGHVLPIEERREFGKLIEQLVVKTQGRSSI